ncbi:MAG: hypothetical protein V7L20_02025 [Nostoc sp.]|uniref:hypothetical protein n=1 Tax=Nostoc sp. TaxID=1180 RepID=UPI002FF9182A
MGNRKGAVAPQPTLELFLGKTYAVLPSWLPDKSKKFFANLTKGQELCKKADFLLGYCFENHWEEPIEDVRRGLRLPYHKFAEFIRKKHFTAQEQLF